ncbi:ATP-binding protein [Oliverpabstia sp. DFI.9.49]|nr:ATP-binding protein [Blautia sp. DFI.9.9]MCC2776454.1 ATP-binding protein [Blautia sp. DFI.4.84]MCG5647174.1 ATP-binding protein [Oliverpabstia sp. DFI.9.49]
MTQENKSLYNRYNIIKMKESREMFIGFSVSNFLSFKSPQTMSMMASKVARHKEHILNGNGKKILKTGLIYGANAGGKSNFIKAIDFSRDIILDGLEEVDLNRKYFRINKEGYRQPGVFEYRLITQSKKEYSYGIAISYAAKEIISEWLVRIEKNGSETCIFNRDIDESGENFTFSEVTHKNEAEKIKWEIFLDVFGKNISPAMKKKSILSDVAERSNEKSGVLKEIMDVYEWFQSIIILFPTSQYSGLNQLVEKEEVRKFFSGILKYFDTGIESVESKQGEMNFDRIFEGIPKEHAEKLKIRISNDIENDPVMFKVNNQVYSLRKDEEGNIITTKMMQNHGNPQELFEYSDESDGTQRLFDLIPLFYEHQNNRVIFIDEIDRSLHTNLTRRFLELFYSLTEKSDCQIIATTHDSNLLDLDLVRQDEIWFIKRLEDHSSKMYSLNRYKERYDKKIDKEYLLGRYDAIPIFDEEILEDMND